MSKLQRLTMIAVVVAAVWLLAMSALSLFANGTFYHAEQPVPVRVGNSTGILVYTRYSALAMDGVCGNELQCGQHLYSFSVQACPLEKGRSTLIFALPLPEDAEGQCFYRGSVVYSPLGGLGPRLTYMWKSETFDAGQAPRKEESK